MDDDGSDKLTRHIYEVIVAYDVTSLEHEVNIALQAGRTLHSGVSIAYSTTTGSMVYAQAVVKQVDGRREDRT